MWVFFEKDGFYSEAEKLYIFCTDHSRGLSFYEVYQSFIFSISGSLLYFSFDAQAGRETACPYEEKYSGILSSAGSDRHLFSGINGDRLFCTGMLLSFQGELYRV